MTEAQRDALRALLRRVDEVRGLAESGGATATAVAPDDIDTVVQTMGGLLDELERSHRRLIETNVQLMSLREVGARLAGSLDLADTTRTVTRYLVRAFGFDHVALLLLDREHLRLAGAWADARTGQAHALELPLPAGGGALARMATSGRNLLLQDCRRHPPVDVDETHPLHETLARLGTFLAVPLRRSTAEDGQPGCGAQCPMGRATWLAPPPDADPAEWRGRRDEALARCIGCEQQPLLGVVALARGVGAPPLGAADLTQAESIAHSLGPMVENARLLQDLRRSERFNLNVLDSMASALVATNLEGGILSFNRAAEELLGWAEADVLGRPLADVIGEEGDATMRRTLAQGRGVHRHETLLRTREGGAVPVRLTTSPLRDDEQRVYGAIATFLDLTPIKRAEERARQMDRLAALGRFTSSVAHEIRNPLTGIGAGVQYLARAIPAEDGSRRHLDFILDEIKRLDRIVGDLFDVTHPRKLDLRPRPLERTLERAAQSLEAVFAQKEVRLDTALAGGLPAVPHDADQIQQVVINLLKNAAEASDAGGAVSLACERTGEGRGDTVLVRVADEGRGIDPATLKTLFEPFVTTKPGGTGLGLYISHDIIKRHGGSLTVHSEPGRGATFAIELPLEIQGGVS